VSGGQLPRPVFADAFDAAVAACFKRLPDYQCVSFSQPLGSPESGADAEVYLAAAPEMQNVSGAYFDRMTPSRAHSQAYDLAVRQKLWQVSLELTSLERDQT
jgi:hypothetical protein